MKKWLIGIGVVLLCIVAAVLLFHLRGKALLTKKIAELKAQGLPTSFAELEEKYKLPAGTPNAADVYMKAFAAYHELPDEEKRKILPLLGLSLKPYSQEEMTSVREFVEQNREMYALLSEAGKVKDCFYPGDYSKGYPLISDLWMDIRQCSQSLIAAEIYYLQTQQPQKAYDAVIDQLCLGQSLDRSPFLISHLLRTTLLGFSSVSGIHEIIN